MWFRVGVAVLILSLFSTTLHAQKINYVHKNVSLVRFFKEIRKQTGMNVVWNEAEFDVNKKIDAAFIDVEIKAVMDEVSAKLLITYTILGQSIVLKNRKVIERERRTIEGNPAAAKVPELNDTLEFNLGQVEIVSTGYQHIPKERAPGSFVIVDSAQLNRKVSVDVFSRLEGITSGLLFNKNTLRSNSGNLDLSIRGRSTIYANDQPLIILDDFPINGDFKAVNPNDVASITVLKDAAAASIWGVRAGNGVIVINTKRGKYNQALNFNFNSNLTISGKPDVFYNPNYLSSSDFIDIETFLFDKGKYDGALADNVNYPVVSPVVKILDRQKKGQSASETAKQLEALRKNDIRREELRYFYQKPVMQQYFLSTVKGTSKSKHYLSAGYDREIFSLVNNMDNRITVSTQHTFKLIKSLELNLGLNYVRNMGTVDSTILGTSGLNSTPYYQFKDTNGNSTAFDRQYSADFNNVALSKGFLDWSYVPLDELSQPPKNFKDRDLRLNGGLKYTVVPGLSAEIKYQYQHIINESDYLAGLASQMTRSLINRYSILTAGQVSGYNIPLGPIRHQELRTANATYLRGQLNYQKDWQKHAVSALAGYELSEVDTQADRYTFYAYDVKTGGSAMVDTTSIFALNPSGTGKIMPNTNRFGNLDRIRSIFANAGYTYLNRYTFSGSARIDGSNYFGVKARQKNLPLWSAGALWHLDREAFFKLNWLPVLKLRASYGYNGNLDKSNTGITTFKTSIIKAAYTGLPFASIINVGNPELKWEKIAIANFSLDFGFKDHILSGKLEYYFKKGTDMLGDRAFPSSTGIKMLRGNYSEMKASGFDFLLVTHNLRGKVKWQTNFLLSRVKDKVTLYDLLNPSSSYYAGLADEHPVIGKPVYGVYSYKSAGLDPSNGDPRGYLNNEISSDYLEIMSQSKLADLEYHGSARPIVFGALNNTISFYKFTLGIGFSYKLGYYFRKSSINYYNMYNQGPSFGMNNDFLRRWQVSGDELFTGVPSIPADFSNDLRDRFYSRSSATVAKGDHIRLQDLSLTFDIGGDSWKGFYVKQMQLYVYATNLGLIWKANDFGLDPDLIPRLNDRFANPLSKSLSLGLKVSF